MRAPITLAKLSMLSLFLSVSWVGQGTAASTSSTATTAISQTNVIPELKKNGTDVQTTTTQVSTQVPGLPASSPPIIINVQVPNTEKPTTPSGTFAAPPPPPSPPTPPTSDPVPLPTTMPTTGAPENKQIYEVSNLKADPLKTKLRTGEIVVQIPPTPSIKLVVDRRFVNSPEIKKLYTLLGAVSTNRTIHFVDNRLLAEASPYDNIVYLQPRSFLDVLNYLSDAVDVPEELVKKGLVPSPRYPNGKILDLKQMTHGLINIYRSKRKPTCNVNVAVYYRNHWFYIKDNDASSKRTFLLAQQLFSIQGGEIGKSAPVLTIPVR